jgi:hypothetical protein
MDDEHNRRLTFYKTPAVPEQLHLADMGFFSKNTIKCARCGLECMWWDYRNVSKHAENCKHKARVHLQYYGDLWYRQVTYQDVPSLANAWKLAELGFYWSNIVRCYKCDLEVNWGKVQDIYKVDDLHKNVNCKMSK